MSAIRKQPESPYLAVRFLEGKAGRGSFSGGFINLFRGEVSRHWQEMSGAMAQAGWFLETSLSPEGHPVLADLRYLPTYTT